MGFNRGETVMTKPTNPNIVIPEGFAISGQKEDFTPDKIQNGFDPIDPDVLAGDNLNKFIDDTYKGLHYSMSGVSDLYKGAVLYDSAESYTASSLVFSVSDDGVVSLYRSLTDNNAGNSLTDGTKWEKVSLGGSGMSIGTLFANFATGSYVPENALPCDGSEYSNSQFPSLWSDYLTGSTPKLLTCTYEEYQAEITEYGNCAKFAVDTSANKFKVPTIKDGTFLQQAKSDTELGKSYSAGLPNIEGSTSQISTDYTSDIWGAGGAFYKNATYPNLGALNTTGRYAYSLGFDASGSSEIYGNSATVQPEAIALRWFVVVANSSENESAMDWSAWSSGLTGKANTSANNFTSDGESYLSGLSMPSSNYVDLTLGASGSIYTAPATGYACLQSSQPNTTATIMTKTSTSINKGAGGTGTCVVGVVLKISVPVQKGQQFQITYTNSANLSIYFVYAEGEEVSS